MTHVDYSARVQTVDDERQPLLHQLMSRFHQNTGCPVLINTSFNVRGEPIVCTPEDAYRCFLATDMDVLVLGRQILLKDRQQTSRRPNAREASSAFRVGLARSFQPVIRCGHRGRRPSNTFPTLRLLRRENWEIIAGQADVKIFARSGMGIEVLVVEPIMSISGSFGLAVFWPSG